MTDKLRASAFTECGPHREQNEDYIYSDESENLFVVADGMGGLSNGKYASSTATKSFVRHFLDQIHQSLPPIVAGETAIRQANMHLYEAAKAKNVKCGTTLTAVYVSSPTTLIFFHVGDSALWRLDRSKSKYEMLTQPDTLEREYVLKGTDQVIASRYKNVLTMAVGLTPHITPHVGAVKIGDADLFILCSDGFSNSISPSDLIALSENTQGVEELAKSAKRLTAESSPIDNFSAIFVEWEGRDSNE